MIAPTPSDIGRTVAYHDRPEAKPELGIVTSFDRFFVFVRYGADLHSRATKASHLEWAGSTSSNRSQG
ncbi:hypothetical protein MKK67_11145 [Methylobacterium sp. J-072]|uniref:hypothetical protein n=1 Tax=Methylobacterium sp. J-072 TaxID=2836651 RepID=UPI001FB946DD|nr:hypothetical protein [Methylobacterium sp. J-072]MCJ2093050.1 hypothetical protein [Methylobacterium sp. J-072]